MESQQIPHSALAIQSIINNTNSVERKFYETVVPSSSSEDDSNTDEEILPPPKESRANRADKEKSNSNSSIDILCNAAANAISAQKDLKGYPDHLEVLKETRTYVFFGPSRKDNYQKYFKAVYSRERNFRIEEGYKVVLEGQTESHQIWNVILIGQATNRHLWVWLHKNDSGDVLMRPISEIVDVVGRATAEEMSTGLQKLREKENNSSHNRREQKRKDSYDRDFAFPKRFKQKSDPESSQDSPTSSPSHHHDHHPTPIPHPYPPTIVNGYPVPYGFPGSPGSHPIVNSIAPIEAVNNYKILGNSPSSQYINPYMYMPPPALSGPQDVSINQNWRKYMRAQLLRMVHELDALDSFEAKKEH